MGTKTHTPDRAKDPSEFRTGHAHDELARAAGPGVRPGVPSRILEARRKLAKP